jgi:hypothetical protein
VTNSDAYGAIMPFAGARPAATTWFDIPAFLMRNPDFPQEPPKHGFGMTGNSLSFSIDEKKR